MASSSSFGWLDGGEEAYYEGERRLAIYRNTHRPTARIVEGLLQPAAPRADEMMGAEEEMEAMAAGFGGGGLMVGGVSAASAGAGHRRRSPHPTVGVCPPPSTADIHVSAEQQVASPLATEQPPRIPPQAQAEQVVDLSATMRPGSAGGFWPAFHDGAEQGAPIAMIPPPSRASSTAEGGARPGTSSDLGAEPDLLPRRTVAQGVQEGL